MREVLINRVVITAEAKFDYEESIGLGVMPKNDMISEVNVYMELIQSQGKLQNERYFRVKYFDEVASKMLMLFLYKREKIACMQLWAIAGLCDEEDYAEELEYDGIVRNWLKTDIEELVEEDDWVETLRDAQTEKDRMMEDYE